MIRLSKNKHHKTYKNLFYKNNPWLTVVFFRIVIEIESEPIRKIFFVAKYMYIYQNSSVHFSMI